MPEDIDTKLRKIGEKMMDIARARGWADVKWYPMDIAAMYPSTKEYPFVETGGFRLTKKYFVIEPRMPSFRIRRTDMEKVVEDV